MNHLRHCILLAAIATAPASSLAADTLLTPDYLIGSWSLNGKAGCGSPDARYVLFRDNGTVEVGEGNAVARVGFWKIVDDTIVGHTLTAPLEHEEYHPFFQDSYRYEYMAPRVVQTEADAFAVTIGSDIEKQKEQYTLTRCK
jgi:hypothetical protein